MIKYDPSILQSVTAARIVELVLKLHKELKKLQLSKKKEDEKKKIWKLDLILLFLY